MNRSLVLVVVGLVALGLVSAQNCALQVPNAPLSATGLATPYVLMNIAGDPMSGMCDEAGIVAMTGTFVQGVIIDLNSGAVTVYNPLVINAGTTPAINPTAPTLPANSVVGLWFGFNGAKLFLQNTPGGTGLTDGNCVNGVFGTVFGEFAHCNAPAWFNAANNAILNGSLVVPPLGTGKDGKPCPTVRDFGVVDQDQSDNVISQYLMVTNNGVNQFAQDTPANRAALGTTNFVSNASDNRLVNLLIDAALGCTPWTVPDLADTTGVQRVGALPLNELFAAARQAPPIALVPENDPMAQLDGAPSVDKINAYRIAVNQPMVQNPAVDANGVDYCQKFATAAFSRIQNAMALLQGVLIPGTTQTLFDFLVNTRFTVSIGPAANGGLDCTNLGVANPFVNGGVIAMNPAATNNLLGGANTTLVIVLAATGGALVLIGAGAAIFIFVQRRNAATTAANNFMAL